MAVGVRVGVGEIHRQIRLRCWAEQYMYDPWGNLLSIAPSSPRSTSGAPRKAVSISPALSAPITESPPLATRMTVPET